MPKSTDPILNEAGKLTNYSRSNRELILIGEGQNIGSVETELEAEAFLFKLKNTSNLKEEELAIIAKPFI